ncbi:unnamed protein product [Dicrocoelium dendriticum]|nr:unnamed protein product [Dicrocoelium dendriticum]
MYSTAADPPAKESNSTFVWREIQAHINMPQYSLSCLPLSSAPTVLPAGSSRLKSMTVEELSAPGFMIRLVKPDSIFSMTYGPAQLRWNFTGTLVGVATTLSQTFHRVGGDFRKSSGRSKLPVAL